jgi:hypothetical protein
VKPNGGLPIKGEIKIKKKKKNMIHRSEGVSIGLSTTVYLGKPFSNAETLKLIQQRNSKMSRLNANEHRSIQVPPNTKVLR